MALRLRQSPLLAARLRVRIAGSAGTARSADRLPPSSSARISSPTAPFAQCHASTIAETGSGLVAAWFGGSRGGRPRRRHLAVPEGRGRRWTAPVEVARGIAADGAAEPCWNPVLFRPTGGPLLLFYKVGPSPVALARDDDPVGGRRPDLGRAGAFARGDHRTGQEPSDRDGRRDDPVRQLDGGRRLARPYRENERQGLDLGQNGADQRRQEPSGSFSPPSCGPEGAASSP